MYVCVCMCVCVLVCCVCVVCLCEKTACVHMCVCACVCTDVYSVLPTLPVLPTAHCSVSFLSNLNSQRRISLGREHLR